VFGSSGIFLSIIMKALSALIYNPWILYFFQHFSIVLRSSYKFALYTYRDLMIFSWVTGEVCIAPVSLLHMLAPSTGWAHFMFTFRNLYPLPLGLSTLTIPLESLWLVSRPWYRFFNLDNIRSCCGNYTVQHNAYSRRVLQLGDLSYVEIYATGSCLRSALLLVLFVFSLFSLFDFVHCKLITPTHFGIFYMPLDDLFTSSPRSSLWEGECDR